MVYKHISSLKYYAVPKNPVIEQARTGSKELHTTSFLRLCNRAELEQTLRTCDIDLRRTINMLGTHYDNIDNFGLRKYIRNIKL